MSRATEEDPEVLADLARRAASERDRSRSRRSVALAGDGPEREVTAWPCRAPRCGQLVGIPQSAVDSLAVWNRELARRGEPPIHEDTVVLCEEHAAALASYRLEAQQRRAVRVTAAVRVLVGSPAPRQEHQALRDLEREGHPDIRGLLESVGKKLEPSTRSGRIRKGEL